MPWDYPQIERMPICDRFGRECFTTIMTNASLGNLCHCPLDCETTRYNKIFENITVIHDCNFERLGRTYVCN